MAALPTQQQQPQQQPQQQLPPVQVNVEEAWGVFRQGVTSVFKQVSGATMQ